MPKIDALFDALIAKGGTDLHIAAGHPPLARVRGDLVPLVEGDVSPKDLEELLVEPLGQAQRARLRTDLDVDFAFNHADIGRFRASYCFKAGGLGAVFRLLPQRVPTLAELSLPEVIWRFADKRAGVVVVAGRRAAGRTTTAAAIVDHINKTRACNILTIEDPIELVHEPSRAQITQREVGIHAPSFATALRSAAREMVDVVFASELRTADALKAALSLASSGVLVLTTSPSSSVAGALDRLVALADDAERPMVRSLLADVLAGVVAQQLVRTVDGKSRVAVHEILLGSETLSEILREGKSSDVVALMESGKSQGMSTMEGALEKLLAAGRISPETGFEAANDKEAFAKVLSRLRPDVDIP